MTEYKPLTKIIIVDNKEYVVCAKYGTSECRAIHMPNDGCTTCPMLAAIFNQLHIFEECILSDQGGVNESDR